MLFSKIIRKKFDAVWGRYDGNDACFYFSPKDFPEIKSENFDVKNARGQNLKGFFYYYGEMRTDRLVIFDHGIGAGHLAYFKEIEYIAKRGYTVYSYDHTGCVASEGDGIYGFAQGVSDLDCVIGAIEADERFKNAKIDLIGHSWGAYSAMNVIAFRPEICHVVSFAGFVSARALEEQYLPKFVLKYSDEVMDRERENNPKYADLDALTSIKNSKVKFFYTQSKDDTMVLYEKAFAPLFAAFKDREDTLFVSLEGRNHEPQHTDRAVSVYRDMNERLNALTKKKKLNTAAEKEAFRNSEDWNAMTEQDPVLWGRVFDFLEK